MDEDLRGRLAAVLAGRSGRPPVRLAQPPVELTGGWASTSVYACSLSAAGPAGDVRSTAVLKLYGADQAGSAHAIREWRALRHLAGTACRVPGALDLEPDPGPLGRPFVLMEHIAGASFWSTYEAAADVGARAALVGSFVQPLVALHALDAMQLEPTADRARGHQTIDVELEGVHHDVEVFPRSGLAEVVRWLQGRRDAVPCARAVIVHRDYHPWNVVVDAEGRVWVLDWDWRVGDPRFDVAWTCTLLQRSGQDAFSSAVRREYESQRGLVLEHFAYFEVLTTVRWLLNVLPALEAGSGLSEAKRADFRSFLREPLHRAQELVGHRTGLAVELTA